MHEFTATIARKTVTDVLSSMFVLGSKAVSLVSGLLAASMILYSSYVLYDTMYTQRAAFSSGWDLMQYKPEIIEDGEMPLNEMGLGMLASINEDTAAWLTVYDTHIDYPVLQGENDLYYASHDIYGADSLTGAIYLSCMNEKDFSDNYNMIYGHHMDNGAMFGDIDRFVDKEYFDAHREGLLVLQDGTVYDLTVFACVSTDAYENAVYRVGDRDLNGVFSYAKAHALQYVSGVADSSSKLCVMSTCASAETNGRLILIAKMDERKAEEPGREKDDKILPVAATDLDGPDDPDGTDIIEDITDDGDDIIVSDDTYNSGIVIEDIADDAEDLADDPVPLAFGGMDMDDPNGGSGLGEDELIADETVPLVSFFEHFTPTGGTHGRNAWALVNLICLAVTFYLFLPVMHIRAKYSRCKKMRKVNETFRCYEEEKFARRFRLGIALELVTCAAALITFLLTENLRLPMTLIDRWTPLMILLLAVCLITDLRLVPYREETSEEGFYGASAPQTAK